MRHEMTPEQRAAAATRTYLSLVQTARRLDLRLEGATPSPASAEIEKALENIGRLFTWAEAVTKRDAISCLRNTIENDAQRSQRAIEVWRKLQRDGRLSEADLSFVRRRVRELRMARIAKNEGRV